MIIDNSIQDIISNLYTPAYLKKFEFVTRQNFNEGIREHTDFF